jgi:transcriptional regulator with XRE-family HTH domain
MIVKKLRLQKSWSQEQLSQFSGLSVRTIQCIERGHQASVESLKSLAAVFQININDLQLEHHMNTKSLPQNEKETSEINQDSHSSRLYDDEKKAMEYVEGIKSFYSHLFSFVCSIALLTAINLFLTPGYLWVLWCVFGWGIGLVSHAIQAFEVFSFFSPEWEKKQIEKRLGREL